MLQPCNNNVYSKHATIIAKNPETSDMKSCYGNYISCFAHSKKKKKNNKCPVHIIQSEIY